MVIDNKQKKEQIISEKPNKKSNNLIFIGLAIIAIVLLFIGTQPNITFIPRSSFDNITFGLRQEVNVTNVNHNELNNLRMEVAGHSGNWNNTGYNIELENLTLNGSFYTPPIDTVTFSGGEIIGDEYSNIFKGIEFKSYYNTVNPATSIFQGTRFNVTQNFYDLYFINSETMAGFDGLGRFSIFSQIATTIVPDPPVIEDWTRPFSTISAGTLIGYPNLYDFTLLPDDDVRLTIERGLLIGPKSENPDNNYEDTPQSIYFGKVLSPGSPTPTAQTSEIRNWNTNITIIPGIKNGIVGTVTIDSDLYVNGNINVTGCIRYNGGTLGTCI